MFASGLTHTLARRVRPAHRSTVCGAAPGTLSKRPPKSNRRSVTAGVFRLGASVSGLWPPALGSPKLFRNARHHRFCFGSCKERPDRPCPRHEHHMTPLGPDGLQLAPGRIPRWNPKDDPVPQKRRFKPHPVRREEQAEEGPTDVDVSPSIVRELAAADLLLCRHADLGWECHQGRILRARGPMDRDSVKGHSCNLAWGRSADFAI
jgi:hypothetical protein